MSAISDRSRSDALSAISKSKKCHDNLRKGSLIISYRIKLTLTVGID